VAWGVWGAWGPWGVWRIGGVRRIGEVRRALRPQSCPIDWVARLSLLQGPWRIRRVPGICGSVPCVSRQVSERRRRRWRRVPVPTQAQTGELPNPGGRRGTWPRRPAATGPAEGEQGGARTEGRVCRRAHVRPFDLGRISHPFHRPRPHTRPHRRPYPRGWPRAWPRSYGRPHPWTWPRPYRQPHPRAYSRRHSGKGTGERPFRGPAGQP
jgi:hypothetical protein